MAVVMVEREIDRLIGELCEARARNAAAIDEADALAARSTGPVTDRKMAEFFAAGDKVQQAHNHKMDVWNRIQESDLAPL